MADPTASGPNPSADEVIAGWCTNCGKPRGTEAKIGDEGAYCWVDTGMTGNNIAKLHCERARSNKLAAECARLTAQLAAATARADEREAELRTLGEVLDDLSVPIGMPTSDRIRWLADKVESAEAAAEDATARAGEAETRLGMATEFNVNDTATIEAYGDGWTVHRAGAAADGKDFTEYLTPAGEWVRVVLSDDYPTHEGAAAAFAALRAGGGR